MLKVSFTLILNIKWSLGIIKLGLGRISPIISVVLLLIADIPIRD